MKKITRREFIKAAAILTGGTFFAGCGSENLREELKNPNVKYLRHIVTANPENSRCIMWESDAKFSAPAVEINGVKIPAVDCSFHDYDFDTIQYTAHIENLSPNTEYEFKICEGEKSSAPQNFKTSSDKKFKAIIFSDSQSRDYNFFGKLARDAFERNSDAEIFIDIGDIVDNGEDTRQWRSVMAQAEPLFQNLIFVPVMGNHECYDRRGAERIPVAYLNYFDVPENGVENYSRRFYSFDYGAAHFVILDSQIDELEQFTPEMFEVQKIWLREDIAKTDKKWKVALLHKDVLQYRLNGRPERKEGFSRSGIAFMPEFENLGFDVVFTAHLHTYRNRGRLKNFDYDPTGPLYIMNSLSGDVTYPGIWSDHALDKVTNSQADYGEYMTLEIDDRVLTVKTFLPDGKLIDEVSLNKV